MNQPPNQPMRRMSRNNPIRRIKDWARANPRLAIFLFVVTIITFVVVITLLVLYLAPRQSAAPGKPKPAVEKVGDAFYSPLTGAKTTEERARRPVTAIMIENSPESRPQSGVKTAGVIYEAIAEGGITRFVMMHQENTPELIGPVRSLRMYYLDWAAAYDACIMHIGGSAAALTEVRSGIYCDGDQFFNSAYYWRATDRYAPHNVYTNTERLDKLNAAKGKTSSTFTGFKRADSKPANPPTASSIDIAFSSPAFNTHYDYEPNSNTYLRSVGGEPSMDREAGRIAPSVVVAMRVNMTHVVEDGARESIETIGTGTATVFQNGTATEVTWTKKSRKNPLVFTTADGKEFPLARGQTWIAAVPLSGDIAWR